MDMKCRKCAEPWDWWYIRDEVLNDERLYQKIKINGGFIKDNPNEAAEVLEVKSSKDANWQFVPGPYIRQCPCCINKKLRPEEQNPNSDVYAALQEVLGDDVDGFMAEIEDFESMGWL